MAHILFPPIIPRSFVVRWVADNNFLTDTPWEQMDGEPHLWYHRFLLYKDMGPSRTMRSAYILEMQREGREKPRSVSATWNQQAKKFKWKERAEAWDAYRRQQVFSAGYAYDLTRISKLDKLARKLEEIIDRELEKPRIPLHFTLERYLQAMDALAQETGGRKKSVEVSGPQGGAISVVFFAPEQEKDDAGPSVSVELPDPFVNEDGGDAQ